MTDKQIIIDGVDVSGCEWFYKNDPCKNTCKYFLTPCERVEMQNCMYKYAKRKEQECEELKEERNEYFELMAIRTEVLAKIANKLGMNTGIIENKELFCKIDQLKAENDELTTINARLLGRLEVDEIDTNLVFNLDKELRQKEKEFYTAIQKVVKLKQTLTEIKEIAEKYNNPHLTHFGEQQYCCKDILQKISECEVENDNA